MANICWFELRIHGNKKNCENMLESLADIECYDMALISEQGTDEDYMIYLSGECPWDITSCMIDPHRVEDPLAEKAKRFDLEVEICSVDESQEIREHFHYKGDRTIKSNNYPFIIYFDAIEEGEVDISEEDLNTKYNKMEDDDCFILKEEYQENVSFDEDTGEIEFDFTISFNDLE